MNHTIWPSPLGDLTLVRDGSTLVGVYFPHHWYKPDSLGARDDGGFDEVVRQLTEYLAGSRTEFDLPARADGDAFQRSVWARIAQVPYGATTTYGAIARAIGQPAMAREVGAAVGRNPLSIVVPCHRVLGKDGELRGYAGGLRRKRFLLDLEQPALYATG